MRSHLVSILLAGVALVCALLVGGPSVAQSKEKDMPRVARKRGKGSKKFAFLTRRYRESGSLTRRAAEADLNQLEWMIENLLSYRGMKNVDYKKAIDTIYAALPDRMSRRDFLLQTRKLVALFGDGHSRVRGGPSAMKGGLAPFGAARVGDRIALLAPDWKSTLVPGYPYVKSIDGVPIAKWIAAAERYSPDGSPQFKRLRAIETLAFVRHLRFDLELPPAVDLKIVVTDKSGRKRKKVKRPLDRNLNLYRDVWPDRPTVVDGVGYLRIAKMDRAPELIARIHRTMDEVRETSGLIIDVRGNGGGTRDALRTLFPYFMKPDDAPRVVNVAKYRLQPNETRDDRGGHLRNRSLFPAGWNRWSPAAKKAIAKTAAAFKPDWKPKPKRFSGWHYMVIEPKAEPPYYHYAKPVIVLQDDGCFSATDIFLGAFAGWRNVTLMGTASGGGSGRTRQYRLQNSGHRVLLSSMASFRPSGARYDGKGVDPDVIADATLEDRLGRSDSVFDAARKRLKG